MAYVVSYYLLCFFFAGLTFIIHIKKRFFLHSLSAIVTTSYTTKDSPEASSEATPAASAFVGQVSSSLQKFSSVKKIPPPLRPPLLLSLPSLAARLNEQLEMTALITACGHRKRPLMIEKNRGPFASISSKSFFMIMQQSGDESLMPPA